MRLLVTRPLPDGQEFSDRLAKYGHDTVLAPLIEIDLQALTLPDPASIPSFLVTSRNALRALAAHPQFGQYLNQQIIAVGPATAALAAELGFQDILQGPGTARALIDTAIAHATNRNGSIIYLAGEITAVDLVAPLKAAGVTIDRITAYRALPASAFDRDTEQALRNGNIDGIVLMSPRTAAIFSELAAAAGLDEQARHFTYFCLSEAVAMQLPILLRNTIRIPSKPNVHDFLELINEDVAQLD